MERDVGDILDRYSIAKLKAKRMGDNEHQREFEAFNSALNELIQKYPKYDWGLFKDMMEKINDFIWQLEAGLKSGKESLQNPYYIFDKDNLEALAKIGTATIIIRNFNSLRVTFKNIINKLAGEGFQDHKKDHLSEDV